MLRHIFDARSPGAEMKELLRREKPHAVVFGHTHVPCFERWGEVILFNPGYAGRQRFKLPRSVGILRCDGSGVSATHVAL